MDTRSKRLFPNGIQSGIQIQTKLFAVSNLVSGSKKDICFSIKSCIKNSLLSRICVNFMLRSSIGQEDKCTNSLKCNWSKTIATMDSISKLFQTVKVILLYLRVSDRSNLVDPAFLRPIFWKQSCFCLHNYMGNT